MRERPEASVMLWYWVPRAERGDVLELVVGARERLMLPDFARRRRSTHPLRRSAAVASPAGRLVRAATNQQKKAGSARTRPK
jgi:hypothetical protein